MKWFSVPKPGKGWPSTQTEAGSGVKIVIVAGPPRTSVAGSASLVLTTGTGAIDGVAHGGGRVVQLGRNVYGESDSPGDHAPGAAP